MTSIDWESVKDDYESGQFSQSALERKYSVSRQAIKKHASKEHWTTPQSVGYGLPNPKTQEVKRPDINASIRAALGFKLRYEKFQTWEEVASGAGYSSRGAALNAVKREAQRHITHDLAEIRDEELYRINQLQSRCYLAAVDKENDGWTWAIDRFVTLSKRKSELMNLDIRPDVIPDGTTVIREYGVEVGKV